MLYFSELKGKRVVTENGTGLGRLSDLIFLADNQPVISKLVVSGNIQTPYIIPTVHMRHVNGGFVVADSFTVSPLAENEMYVSKNLLDQQILDIRGNKVVRVNDVAIQDKPQFVVAGVDIGIVGILRWFGADETFGRLLRTLGITVTSQFLSWADIQPLALSRGHVIMRHEEKKLAKLRPEDLADHLETLNVRNAARMLDLMGERLASSVIENLNITYQQNLFKQFTPQRSAKIIEPMDDDESVDILLSLTPRRRGNIMNLLSSDKQKRVTDLMNLSTTPIGGMITNKFFTARTEETAGRIRARIKTETEDFSSIFYVYAVNAARQLVGVANLHELLMAPADAPLYRFMNPSLIVLHMTTPVPIAIRRMLKYRLEGLPVIDNNKHILGVVTINELDDWMLTQL